MTEEAYSCRLCRGGYSLLLLSNLCQNAGESRLGGVLAPSGE